MSKLKEFLRGLKSCCDEDNRKVVKTIEVKPEWKKKWDELKEVSKESEKLQNKRKSLKASFWSMIEIETDTYENMRYNEEDGVIEILEDNEDGE